MNAELSKFRVDELSGQKLANQPLLIVACAVALGIVADRYDFVTLSVAAWWVAALAAVLLAVVFYIGHFLRTSLVTVLFAFFLVGSGWHDLHWNYWRTNELARYALETTEPVCLQAIATRPSTWRAAPAASPLRAIPAEPRSEVEIRVVRIRSGTRWRAASGKVRLRVNGILPTINPGDRLLVYARLSQLSPAINPGQYDYAIAERMAGRHCELFTQSPACVQVVAPASNLSLGPWLARLGRHCEHQLARYVDPQQQPIAETLLFGVRGELDEETTDAFMKTGTIHLLVVSGMHVALIALATWLLAGLFPISQKWRLILTLALVITYAAIVGWQPSVVRSTVFVVISFSALTGFRRATPANGLAAAALLVMLINPSELFRPGTQLSFLGVAAVVASARWLWPRRSQDPIEKMIASYHTWWQELKQSFLEKVRIVCIASLAASIVLTPLLLFHFNIISPSSVVLSPVAWVPMSIALITGLLVCTVGFLLPPVAWLLGVICSASLGMSEWLIVSGSNAPASYGYFPGPSLWWLVSFYLALGVFSLVPKLRPSLLSQLSLGLVWIAIGFGVAAWNHTAGDELRCTFLAVGHGTCVVVELPSGETLLYDAGSLGSPEAATNTISSFLWSRGISHIDAIVVSHADVDHYNGVPGLVERFSVDQIFISPMMFDPWATDGQLSAPNYLKEKIDAAGVVMEEVWMNDKLVFDDLSVTIEVLHPPQFGVAGRDNANSLLLVIEYAGQRILLPGDLESPGIETVMAEAPLDVDLLLAPHHGSAKSDPPGFAKWCTPEWVVLSGRDTPNQTPITTASYREAGATVLHTATDGAAEFFIGPEGIRNHTFR